MTSRKKILNFPCLLTTPSEYNPLTESIPMIVFLHGAGERGDDINTVCIHGIPKLFSHDPEYAGIRAVTLSPQCPPEKTWNCFTHELMQLIDTIAELYNIDKKRISLTGLSMGGYGTWEMAMTYPDYFSAIAPICGGGMPWRAAALTQIPIRAFHGDLDRSVPITESETMIRAIEAAGGKPSFTVYEGFEHDCWTAAYETTDLILWLASQKRD